MFIFTLTFTHQTPICWNSLPNNTSSPSVRYSVLTVLYYLCDPVHLPEAEHLGGWSLRPSSFTFVKLGLFNFFVVVVLRAIFLNHSMNIQRGVSCIVDLTSPVTGVSFSMQPERSQLWSCAFSCRRANISWVRCQRMSETYTWSHFTTDDNSVWSSSCISSRGWCCYLD